MKTLLGIDFLPSPKIRGFLILRKLQIATVETELTFFPELKASPASLILTAPLASLSKRFGQERRVPSHACKPSASLSDRYRLFAGRFSCWGLSRRTC